MFCFKKSINYLLLEKKFQESALDKKELDAIRKEIFHYEDVRAVSIEALKIVQKNRGWVSDEILKDVARLLGLSICELEELATFYNQIFRKPVGNVIIRYCDSVVCFINDYQKIQFYLEQKLNIHPGETSSDGKFTLLPVCCLGKCDKGPVMMVNNDTYINLTLQGIDCILEKYK